MEIQHVCVPMTEYLWQRMSGPFARAFTQAPVLSLICQCLVWMIIFYLFHRLQLFFQSRERLARHQKLSHGHKILEDAERNAIEQLSLKFQTGAADDSGGAAEESLPLVTVSICVDEDSCGVDASRDLFADRSLILDAASQLRAPGQEVTVIQTCAGPIVQTKVTRPPPGLCAVDTLTTSTTSSQAAAKKSKSVLVQLGGWRIFRPSTVGEEPRMLKLDDTNPMPVILHSSYAGGKLTVEGLHLRQATIQAATKNKCIKLDTIDKSTTEYVLNDISDLKGLSQLQVFTFETRLPSKNLAEVCVVASKKMDLHEFKLSVHSLAVQIQNDNLRTVLRSAFPCTILAIYATKQILSSMMRIVETTNTTSFFPWLLLCIVVVSTQALPLRMETTITDTLKKMALRTYDTLYFAAQCFIYDEDSGILSMHKGDSRCGNQPLLKNEGSSSFQSGMSAAASPSNGPGDSKDESQMNEENMKAIAHNSTVDSPAWEWPVFDSVYNESTRKYDLVERVQGTTDQMVHPFEVIYHNFKDLPWASQGEVCILSPILMEIINELIPEKLDQSARCKKKLSLNRRELFQILEGLRKKQASTAVEQEVSEASSSSNSSTSKREKLIHLNHLLRFMDKEFKEIEGMYVAMKSEKRCVSWEMLWAFFPRGERVVYSDNVMNEMLCGDVLDAHYKKNKNDDKLLLQIEVTSWDYNCKTWKQYSRKLEVPLFKGELEICTLNIYPIQFEEDPQISINYFLHHGSRFCELSMMQRNCFMNYKGSMVRYKLGPNFDNIMHKENADGRVMIDLWSFAKMNPAHPASSQLQTAKPPNSVIRNNEVTTYDIRANEDRIFAPAMVYGFSFRVKQWGSFFVGGFSDINFNTSAFDDLVMDEDIKDVIEKLVQRKLKDGTDTDVEETQQLDPIACKGEGLIFLCYGPPGTGKTLTAESLSEKLECPLWCLSVSELGITPATLEATLVKVFDVATSWGALLLFDEADVFLERRTTSDLTRNAMTGVFLRLLEYYKGVIFLTTNRDSAFDDAIISRIAMKVHYERLHEDQRKKIWTKMFARVGLKDISVAEFAKPDFNGREIRNIVTTAHILSRSEDNRADMEIKHVQKAFKVYKDSCKVWATAPHL